MVAEAIHQQLGWPSAQDVLDPPGPGPKVYALLAQRKVQQSLTRFDPQVRVGVLTGNPSATDTEAPIAVVCHFQRALDPSGTAEAHRLAWSFCRSPLLVTIEPHLVRAWTCYERPSRGGDHEPPIAPVTSGTIRANECLEGDAARALQWVELTSGNLFRVHGNRFRRNERADQLLLRNLKCVRSCLRDRGLCQETAHDLLARLIFVQFLFHRQDSSGRAALSPERMQSLHTQGVLSAPYETLEDVLTNKADTYALFRWLDDRFNGDLFPGKTSPSSSRDDDWAAEISSVRQDHLRLLADFVGGRLRMEDGQLSLWQLYSFDAIPLEFVSSIYEDFVSKSDALGAHYTRNHVVDFVLDGVLPWGEPEWDLRILDPACGSGIFLVKAFQRLIHRWKVANPDAGDPPVSVLRRLLERNLAGVDTQGEAVRVASFSLYLAMCDEIDPRHYWTQVRFPRLRGVRLLEADFFSEETHGIRTTADAASYDLVIGNAPWGKRTATPLAEKWAKANGKWPIANRQIGTLFLPKAAKLARPGGRVSMLQPAASLLWNTTSPCVEFRRRLFSELKVEQVVNLAPLRFVGLFTASESPVCIITLQASPADGEPISYWCPKPIRTAEDTYRLAIEADDQHFVLPKEAASEPWVWSALGWAGRRDLNLVRRLMGEKTLAQLPGVKHAEGLIWARRPRHHPGIEGRPCLDAPDFPAGSLLTVSAHDPPPITDPRTHRMTDLSPFEPPQLLVKQAWTRRHRRLQARLVSPDANGRGTLCTQSYLSVHVREQDAAWLEAAALAYNSIVATYFLLMTSGRFAFDRTELLKQQLMAVPVPAPLPGMLKDVDGLRDVDLQTRGAFGLTETEWALIEDVSEVVLADFRGQGRAVGCQSTRTDRRKVGLSDQEPDLVPYCDHLLRVLEDSFGRTRSPSATVFQDRARTPLPVRLVAVRFGPAGGDRISGESLTSEALISRLRDLYDTFMRTGDGARGSVAYGRVVRVYDTSSCENGLVPTVFIAKPNQRRYWLRSSGLRDGDAVVKDIVVWAAQSAEAASEGGLLGAS